MRYSSNITDKAKIASRVSIVISNKLLLILTSCRGRPTRQNSTLEELSVSSHPRRYLLERTLKLSDVESKTDG